jgi:choline dehydrogenase-like flavoprotein
LSGASDPAQADAEIAVDAKQQVDAIVVGSGAAGGWAAKELTEKGLTVLLLEAGRSITPEIDYPLPAPAESRLATRLTNGLTRQPVQMRCAVFNARTRRFFVNDRENPYTTPPGNPFNWFRGRQVGGRLHTWARVAVRLSDLEFKGASRDGWGVDWPLSYDDLAPYYTQVETFLGVYGCADRIPGVPDGAYIGAAEMTPEEARFKGVVESAFPDRHVLAARVVKHDPGRVPLTIRAAPRTGRLVVRSDAVVRHITIDPNTGHARGVAFLDRITKNQEEARANVVVLCASTIESVRILLNSACPRHATGLGNSSGRLGRGLMDHVMLGLAGPAPPAERARHDAEADPYDFGRATGFYIPRFRNAERPHAGFRRGYTVQGGIGRGPSWYLLAHGEMLAQSENRISVDAGRRDAWGIPVARIECTLSSNETAMIEDASATMREMAEAAGLQIRMPPSGRMLDTLAFNLWKNRLLAPSGAFWPGSAIHEIGGAPMGDDPAVSVLNRFGQCWDAPNVFVTDGACFPSGCSQNITLTIMALTVRACDHLVKEYRTGRL